MRFTISNYLSGFIGIHVALLVILMIVPSGIAQETKPIEEKPALRDLSILQARLTFELAQVELQMARQFNKEIENSLSGVIAGNARKKTLQMKMTPPSVLERLKSNVVIAQEKVVHAESGSTSRPKKVQLRHAQEKVRLAQFKLQAAQDSRGSTSAAASELQIKRLKIISEIAKVRLEMPDQPEYLIERIDVLQWQIDKLTDEFMSLEQRIAAIEDRLDNR